MVKVLGNVPLVVTRKDGEPVTYVPNGTVVTGKGDTGATPNLTVGSVTSGAPGASITGNKENPVLNLTIPPASFEGIALGNTDLNTITASGIYNQTTNAEATLARNYPVAGQGGTLEVMERGFTQRYTPRTSTTRGFYLRNYTSGTWSGWRFFGYSRVDNTAGRAIYIWDDTTNTEQLVYGDTGWRDVSGLLVNGWTVVDLLVRRTGNTIEWEVTGLDPTNATSVQVNTGIGAGWRPRRNRNVALRPMLTSSQSTIWGSVTSSSGVLQVSTSTGISQTGTSSVFSYTTTESWPATLPGTAV